MDNVIIGERPESREGLAAWYSTALKARRSSGLTMVEYAVKVGVSVRTLYQWQRWLSVGARDGQHESKLVEVTEACPASEESDVGMVVRLNGGRRSIVVPHGFDCEELSRLIGVLESC